MSFMVKKQYLSWKFVIVLLGVVNMKKIILLIVLLIMIASIFMFSGVGVFYRPVEINDYVMVLGVIVILSLLIVIRLKK